MQVTVEESGAIERRITVSVPHAEVEREIEKRLRALARRARIPGFRPGKAPRGIVDKRYGAQVTDEVVSDTINTSYREALGKESIEPAGLLSIEPKPFAPGDDLRYTATVELYPPIPSPTLAGRTIEKPRCAVTAEDVERTLLNIRKQHADFVAKEGKSEKGDRITIDFDGTIDGNPFAGGSAENHRLVLGEGDMLDPFESELLGLEAGAAKQVAFTFPDRYPGGEVAGKAASFEVVVKAVERRVLPECDEAFARKLGVAEGGMEKMRAEIEVNLQRELDTRMRAVLRDRVMDELVKANEIEVPKALIEAEIERRMKAVEQQMAAQGMAKQQIEREHFAADAKRQVLIGLVAREIMEKFDLKVDSADLRRRIEEMAADYDDSEAWINWHYSEPARLRRVEAMMLEEQVVERMLETAAVTEKKVSFQEFMNPAGE